MSSTVGLKAINHKSHEFVCVRMLLQTENKKHNQIYTESVKKNNQLHKVSAFVALFVYIYSCEVFRVQKLTQLEHMYQITLKACYSHVPLPWNAMYNRTNHTPQYSILKMRQTAREACTCPQKSMINSPNKETTKEFCSKNLFLFTLEVISSVTMAHSSYHTGVKMFQRFATITKLVSVFNGRLKTRKSLVLNETL